MDIALASKRSNDISRSANQKTGLANLSFGSNLRVAASVDLPNVRYHISSIKNIEIPIP
jgi:hypothetical protein